VNTQEYLAREPEMIVEARTAAALERIATALEQMALDMVRPGTFNPPPPFPPDALLTGEPPLPTPPADLPPTTPTAPLSQTVALPPVQPFQFTGPSASCPVHRVPWKTVPAGTSKKTGKPYGAFLVCSVQGCEERPRA
jgi:hypothetical protein